MKKIFTLLCICCLGFGAMAQLPINLGVHGGISSNRIKFKDIPQAIGTQYWLYGRRIYARQSGKTLSGTCFKLFA
mgnify:CR=1 FL=1